MEDIYTSTGSKLAYWWERIEQYKRYGRTNPVYTHISPEGSCNLKCAYCSVIKRKRNIRIDLPTIILYLHTLIERGLKAVTLTGGGEPCLYPEINELISFIISHNLKCALITNGTCFDHVDSSLLNSLSWIRISVNDIDNIQIPKLITTTTLGLSYIVSKDQEVERRKLWKLAGYANAMPIEYVRLLPNCLQSTDEIERDHQMIERLIETVPTAKFLHQKKNHGIPPEKFKTCPMGYFRPYLSEQVNEDGVPGTIYPCDSVVLNDDAAHFNPRYAIGPANRIGDYLDGKLEPRFCPAQDCTGCVFVRNLNKIKEMCEQEIVPPHVEFI